MDAEAAEALVTGLKKALRSAKPWYFWFSPKGADGAAVLLVCKKASTLKKQARAARKVAKVKLDATGPVHAGPDGLVFCDDNEGKIPAARIEKLFKSQLAKAPELKKASALLRKATVVATSAFVPVEESADQRAARVDGGFDGLRQQVRSALDRMPEGKLRKKLEKRLDKAVGQHARKPEKAHDALETLLAELQPVGTATTGDTWDTVLLEAKAAHRAARELLGAESAELAALEVLRRRAIDANKAGDERAVDLLRAFVTAAGDAEPLAPEVVARAELAAQLASVPVTDAELTLDASPPTVQALAGSWSGAVVGARMAVNRFKAAVVQHPGIRFDARFELVTDALADFDPVPDFGDALEAALRAGDADTAREIAVDHRSQVEVAPHLDELSKTSLAPCDAATILIAALDTIVAAATRES